MSPRFLILPALVLLCTFFLPNLTSNYTLKAQSIDEMLQSRGLSFEQAQQMAQNAGVDPNNPNELAAFARQNGVPENQIQQYLVQLREQQNSTSVSSGPTSTDLTETVVSSEDVQEVSSSAQISNPTPPPSANPQNEGLPYFGYNVFGKVIQDCLPSGSLIIG